MNPLSLPYKIIGLLTCTIDSQLIPAGYSYGNFVKEFPGEIRDFVGGLSTFISTLHALIVIMGPPEVDNGSAVTTGLDLTGIAKALAIPLEDYGKMLSEMVRNLEKYQKSRSGT